MSNWKIPLFVPDLTEEDLHQLGETFRSKWLTMGEQTQKFEKSFAQKIQVPYAYAVSNGTAALHLALLALGIQPGDEVLVPSFTFVACANVIVAVGAQPVFVDIANKDDWTISPEDLEKKITERTRGILLVHYAGFPAQMDSILAIARRYELPVIEDCAHALVSYDGSGVYCGTFGDIGCFSFFSNKNMTTGEGGMVVTRSERLAERLRLLRAHGMTSPTLDRHEGRAISYDVALVGLNYRIDELRSTLGICQLQRLDGNLQKRQTIYETYLRCFEMVEKIGIPFQSRKPETVGYHIFPVLLPKSVSREAVIREMRNRGIQTSIHYPPIHLFTAYQKRLQNTSIDCPLTEVVADRELTLPFYPSMTQADVEYVVESLQQSVNS